MELLNLRELKFTLPERALETLFGPYDQNIKYLESLLSVRVGGRGGELLVEGDEADVATVEHILKDFSQLFSEGKTPSDGELREAFKQVAEDRSESLRELLSPKKIINPGGRKQISARTPMQRRYLEAIEKNDVVFGIGPAGTGKCIAADALVLTSEGMMEISALGKTTHAAQYQPLTLTIHGLAGAENTSHIYSGGESKTLRVTTRGGFSIEATPEHPLMVMTPLSQLEWRRADELKTGDVLTLQRGQKMFGTRTTIDFHDDPLLPSPINISELDDEFAYLLGVIVGGGCLIQPHCISLTTADEPIVALWQSFAKRVGLPAFSEDQTSSVASSQFYQLLLHLGLSNGAEHTKRIPQAILSAPQHLVAAFLRGLFDINGAVENYAAVINLSSVAEKLMQQIQIVLLNFGIVANRSDKQAHSSHVLTITGADANKFDELIGFGLECKRAQRQNSDHVATAPSTVPQETPSLRLRVLYPVATAPGTTVRASTHVATALGTVPQLLDPKLFFAEISSIESSCAQVFDLSVPGTHSFVANGFINHNTYLAVAMAVQYLMSKQVNRIILARPAVEAGEKLGFLPGDLQDKVDPYLRPIYDALFDVMDHERVTSFLEKRVIEVAPLAFMRGRAQTLDSLLLTPTGWRKMGEIKVGDFVIGSTGKPIEVLGVFPQGRKKLYHLTMTDEASTVACAEHLWQVKTTEDRAPQILETQEMIGNLHCHQQYRYELPLLSAPVQFSAQPVSLDPYALGLWLGDGCLSDQSVFSLAGHSAIPVRNSFPQINLAGTLAATKFIPPNYLYNSAEVRLALLQGLLDTEGGAVIQAGRTCRIQYSTASEKLKDDVVFLVRSLGGVTTQRVHNFDSYTLDIRLPETISPFRSPRKVASYEKFGGGRPLRFIKNIEYLGEQETQCIRVAAFDSLYVTDDFILTHNTLSDAFIILDEAQNTTSEQMKMFLTRIGFGSKAVITGDVTQIDLPSGRKSGLIEAQHVVRGIPKIEFIEFTDRDVVRHHIVQLIVRAYDAHTRKINL